MTLPSFAQSARQSQQNTAAQRTQAQQQSYIMPEQLRPPRPQDAAPPPDPKNWQYKGAIAGPNGEQLPSGAQGWTPYGQPYFGKGIGGTLKKYQWMMFGSPTSGQQAGLWDEYVNANGFKEKAEIALGGIFGTDIRKPDEESVIERERINTRLEELKAQYVDPALGTVRADAPPEIKAEYNQLAKQQAAEAGKAAFGRTTFETESGTNISLLTPILRGSKVAITALFDVLQEGAIKVEQGLSAQAAVQEFTNEQGGNDLSFDIDRKADEASEKWQSFGNLATRILFPPLQAWDTLKFITAPGTVQEKQEAVATGWDAGKMYYSTIIKPSLMEEFKRRAAAGEDTQLLALELQNPYAEMAGQFILDPLNVVGAFAKAGKMANLVADAENTVRGGTLGDEFAELLTQAGKSPIGETRAAQTMDNLDTMLVQKVDDIEAARLTPDYNKATAYSPSGLRIREAKNVGVAADLVTGAILRNGGSSDDVADWFASLAKMTDVDKSKRMEAVNEMLYASNRFGMGRLAMSDDMVETGILLRNLTEDGEDLLKVLRSGKGDMAKTIDILSMKLRQSIEKQIPTLSELKKAEAGTKQAEQYAKIKPLQKALWNLNEGKLGTVKNAINSTLGKFYFNQPGFVVRNATNNLFTMLVDTGVKKTVKALFTPIEKIDTDIAKYFGGQLPPGMKGLTLVEAEKANAGAISKWNMRVEENFAKRIYWSRFRDQMDMFLTPGAALPTRAELGAVGLSDDAIDEFVHLVRHNGGNIDEAFAKFAGQYDSNGLSDLWKRWTGSVSQEEYKGLRAWGLTDQIDEIKDLENATPAQIQAKFKEIKQSVHEAAKGAENNVTGIPNTVDAPFADDMGRAAEKYGNTDKYQHLSVLITKDAEAEQDMMDALFKANTKFGTTPQLRQRFEVMSQAFSAQRGAALKLESNDLWKTFWGFADKKAPYTPQQIWDSSILSKRGEFPKGLDQRKVLDELKKATDDHMAMQWEKHFAQKYDALQPLIDDLVNQFPEIEGLFRKAQKSSAELAMYRSATFRNGKMFAPMPPRTAADVAKKYGVSSATEAGVPLDKQLLNTINKYSDVKYKNLDEANQNLGAVEEAFKKRAGEKGVLPQAANEVQIVPPASRDAMPLPGEAARQSTDGIIAALNKVERSMLDNFGIKAAEGVDGKALNTLKNALQSSRGRLTESVAMADKVAKHWRDFAMLPYGETKNFDLALSYVFPYQFWYSRSYSNWMKRIATDPQVMANYARLKDAMSKENSDSPEWWRYNVVVPPNFLGIFPDHETNFNLEASIWPLQGLTGTDFNDPEKRVNWWTSSLDDMGKMGPSLWAPINIATALYLRAKGEDEAASRWANRLIPQTTILKTLGTEFLGKPVELDPMVQMFSGNGLMDFDALDPYERKRVGRALAAMVSDGIITEEQAVDIAESQEGELWDVAVQRAAKTRSLGNVLSFLGGVGMKARTEQDKQIDQFYQEYYRLNNLNEGGLINPQDYQQGWDTLREKYPFMDALLLSRKAGPDREKAYAYNILGRIPPGQAGELYELAGIDRQVAQEFYENKGDMTNWDEGKRERFLAAMKDLGAMLSIPSYATKQDWNDARNQYKSTNQQMMDFFGADIQDKIDHYYGMDDRTQAKLFLDSNPDISAALSWQKQATINNPVLYEYYGGIKTLESYYKSKMYDELYGKYGKEIASTWEQYYAMQLVDPKGAARFKKAHPELALYSKEKKRLQVEYDRKIVEFASRIPEAPRPELRGNEPQNPIQEAIQGYATETPMSFEQWQQTLGPTLTGIIAQTYQSGRAMPAAADRELDFKASQYGFESGDDLLRAVLISMNR